MSEEAPRHDARQIAYCPNPDCHTTAPSHGKLKLRPTKVAQGNFELQPGEWLEVKCPRCGELVRIEPPAGAATTL